jgi:hypothetical protein
MTAAGTPGGKLAGYFMGGKVARAAAAVNT